MISNSTVDLVIIGGGPAGLSAAIEASQMGASAVVLEAADAPGGLTRSFERDGYTFDCSGHLLHLSDPRAVELVERATGKDSWNRLSRRSVIYLDEKMVPYPFQLHLAHAPERIRIECLSALPDRPPENADGDFGRWIAENLGDGIARHFMVPYNEKLATVSVDELTTEWLGRFVPQPSLDEIRAGAATQRTIQTGYNRSFLYPARGGIASLSAGLAGLVPNLLTNARATQIDTGQRVVTTDDGRAFAYGMGVIATNPLPQLASMVTPTGASLLGHDRLRANSVTCVNVGLKAANPDFSAYQWTYLPELRFSAYRLGFYNRFADTMAPAGHESVYVEIAHGAGASEAHLVDAALGDLLALNVIDDLDAVDTVFPVRIDCAYVIHDRNVAGLRAAIHRELADRDILVAGRYARWEYSAMENAIVQGMEAVRMAFEDAGGR